MILDKSIKKVEVNMKTIWYFFLFFVAPLSLFAETLYVKLADKLTEQYIKEMTSEGFKVVLTGGAMFNDVKQIFLWFHLDDTPTL